MILHCTPPEATLWVKIIDWISRIELDPGSVIQYSAIISGFISITLPISLDIVSKNAEDFKDKDIAKLFLRSWTYIFQVYINLLIAFISILLIALKQVSIGWMLLIVVMDLIAIVVFVFFIRTVQIYATNFSDYYSNKLKKQSDDIVQGQ